jgi:UPF0755 protein
MTDRKILGRYLLVACLALLLAGAGSWLLWERYQQFLDTPLDIDTGDHVFVLAPGSTGFDIVRTLDEQGLTRQSWKWRVLMRLEPHVYRSGEYRLAAGMLPRDVLEELASGRVIQYRLTLVEGWTFSQVAALIDANEVLEHRFALSDPEQRSDVLSALDLEHPEGWFLPETYQFSRGDSDVDILERAHRSMREELSQAWASRDEELPLDSPYELLILASIIEKETGLEEERGQIAGVFTRRLKKGMRLQTDPTVIYGLGDGFDGDIRRRDLQTDTPYNTYTRHGLPPTPIAMPGRASLQAAAQPADGETLYFVADGHGGHTFSVTLEEHQAAVNRLLGRE